MTLLDAKVYDPAPARRRKIRIVVAVVVILILAAVVWMNRYWSEKRVVDKFFNALQSQRLRDGLRDLFRRSAMETASRQISQISLEPVHSGLGCGRTVGNHQKLQSEWRKHLRQRRQRGGGGCHRQRPRRTCPIMGGKIGQDLEPAALRIALPVV